MRQGVEQDCSAKPHGSFSPCSFRLALWHQLLVRLAQSSSPGQRRPAFCRFPLAPFAEADTMHPQPLRITKIQIVPATPAERPVCGYCSLTLADCFAVHDLRILQSHGRYFVAMPSRRRTLPCSGCGTKLQLHSAFCHQCGTRQRPAERASDLVRPERTHVDIAHPITSEFRQQLEQAIIAEYLQVIASARATELITAVPSLPRISATPFPADPITTQNGGPVSGDWQQVPGNPVS